MDKINSEAEKDVRDRALETARSVLDHRNNRLNLVIGILACMLATVAVIMLVSAFNLIFDLSAVFGTAMAAVVTALLQGVLVFLLACPLYLGLFRAALDMCRGCDADFSRLFGFFGSFRMLLRAWGIQIRILWRALPTVAVFWIPYLGLFEHVEPISRVVLPAALLSAPLLLFWGACRSSGIFPFAAAVLLNDEVPLGASLRYVRSIMSGRRFAAFAFRIRLGWRLVLSLLSVGVVTLLHALPLALLSYSAYSRALLKSGEL